MITEKENGEGQGEGTQRESQQSRMHKHLRVMMKSQIVGISGIKASEFFSKVSH